MSVGSQFMDKLFNSDLVIGKKTVSYDQTITANDSADYVVGYNPTDFFYVNVDSSIMPNNCDKNAKWKLDDVAQDSKCDTTPDINNDNGLFCYQRELCKNQQYSQKMMSVTDKHSGSNIRYLDIATQTNFQAISVANLTIGVSLMIYTMFSYW